MKKFSGLDEFVAAQGAELGPTDWLEVTQDRVNLFADATDDHQWIHIDPERAANGPFGGTIAHGMLVLAFVSEMLTAAFGRAWLETGRLKIRFRAPARPGDTVTATGRITKAEDNHLTCAVECRSSSSEVLIDGSAEVWLA